MRGLELWPLHNQIDSSKLDLTWPSSLIDSDVTPASDKHMMVPWFGVYTV